MAEVEVRDLTNKVVGKLELSDDVFNYSASETLVWEAVNAYLSDQRKGTHAAKNRSDVRGGGRKLWRQKGTGRARVGSLRSPLWPGGGTTHGPRPRDYRQAFPKRKRRGAMKLVLSDMLRNNQLLVVDALELTSPKTKDFVEVLKRLEVDRKVLVVDSRENRELYLSSRNLPDVKMAAADGVNIHDLVGCRHLLISKRAILQLQEVLQR